MRGNVHRRLEELEIRSRLRPGGIPQRSTGARNHMKAHLDQVARLRRGELGLEEAAEVEAMNAAVERRLASRWGEGRT